MRRISFVLFLIVFSSCSIQYDGDTRLIVEARVVDSNGNPLVGKCMAALVADGFETEAIANGVTDALGYCRISFPAPKIGTMRLEIAERDPVYLDQNYIDVHREDFTDYKFGISAVLFKKDDLTTLKLDLRETQFDHEISNVLVNAIQFTENVYYNEAAEDVVSPKVDYLVRKNQSAVVDYDVLTIENNMPVTTHHSETIVIDSDPVTYPIIY